MNMSHDLNTTAKNYLIIGLGETGLSCARFLAKQKLDVAVMDTREQPPALTELQYEHPEVVIKTGGLEQQWLLNADMIVLSPGVDPRTPEIMVARNAGVEIIGDIELFAQSCNAPVIAITGSNGKSTVTTLLSLMAELSGKNVKTGGNLGTPALDLLTVPAPDFYILELSSFQLESTQSLNAFASAVLNISPDHLDRYNTMNDYIAAKSHIYSGDGVMIINRDDVLVADMGQPGRMQIGFSLHESQGVDFGLLNQAGEIWLAEGEQPLMPVREMKIVGKHNIANALAALALGSAMGLPMPIMLSALKSFKGLPHRCRWVRQHNQVDWFNDSKATNVGATLAAIDGLADRGKIVLIAGGVGKGQDFSELTPVLAEHARAVVLIGEAASDIANVIPESVQQLKADSLKQAVTLAAEVAESGDQVMLSPACASFDMFKSYADRGDQFERLVREVLV